MDFSTLGNHISNAYIFNGPKQKPFLAPRGVYVSGEKLFVSDTGQNRVLIWHQIPSSNYADPDVVLGQETIKTSGRNLGDTVSSKTLQYPSGIWSDGTKLIVADAWNHRVLIWHALPAHNAQPADVVLGQPHFDTNHPNVEGIAANPSDNTLHWPYGVFSDGTHLWIADTGNRRILFFETIPTENFTPADAVIGKPDFTTRDYENKDPIWPYSVKINNQGYMAVADTQFYRILVWKNWKTAFTNKADLIIGQNSFEDSGQNQFLLQPRANTLNWTYDACFYKGGILVNDTGNSRILGFHSLPNKNNAIADFLIGRPDFNTSSEYKGNLMGTESTIYWPFSIITQGKTLFMADTGNHRLVIGTLNV